MHTIPKIRDDVEEESKETHVDRPEPRTMPCSHILIEAFNGIRARELAVLLVHVVCTRARVITDPDTEVFDLQWLLFVNLDVAGTGRTTWLALYPNACLLDGCKDSTHNINTNDFTIGLFDLLQLSEDWLIPFSRVTWFKDEHT
jgi:hypothetical protein